MKKTKNRFNKSIALILVILTTLPFFVEADGTATAKVANKVCLDTFKKMVLACNHSG